MQTVWLIFRATGELFHVDAETVERVVGIEFNYLAETINSDGAFANGDWLVFGAQSIEFENGLAIFLAQKPTGCKCWPN